jgi:hypothetical protein
MMKATSAELAIHVIAAKRRRMMIDGAGDEQLPQGTSILRSLSIRLPVASFPFTVAKLDFLG